MKMKKLLALCLAGSMTLGIAGCSSGETSKSGGADSKETQTEKAAEDTKTADDTTAADDTKAAAEEKSSGERQKFIISCYLADESQVAVREKYIDEPLKEAFPDVDIEIKMYSDRQSLQVEVAGGGGPDILDLDGPTDVAEFAKADRVLDLGAYSEKYGWKDMFYDWAYNSCFFREKLYSLPTAFEGMVMYYNMDIMNENNCTIPKNAAELETLMKAMKDKGIIPVSFGNSNYQGAVDWLYSTFLSCNAGPDNLKNALEGNIKFDDPSMVTAMNQMVGWWQEGYLGDNASQSITNEDMLAFFAEGRAGMMISGTWASNQLMATYPDCNWQQRFLTIFSLAQTDIINQSLKRGTSHIH